MEPLDLLRAFHQAFNRHDVAAMMELMTEDCVFENTDPPPAGTRYQGAVQVGGFWRSFFRDAPRAQIEIEQTVLLGEHAYQRWTYHWGDGYVRGVDLFRFEGEKIAEKLSYVKG